MVYKDGLVPRAKLKRLCGLCFQTCNRTAKLQHGLGLVHTLRLEDQVLQPVVAGLDAPGHLCELAADDSVLDELLAKRYTLVGVFDRFFVADAREANRLNDDADTFMVEVGLSLH